MTAGSSDSDRANRSGSRAWRVFLRVFFKTTPTPVMRLVRRMVASAPLEELIVVGRRTGRERRLMVTLLKIDGRWYVGHPNGASQWVRNLAAAGGCVVVRRVGQRTTVTAIELADGPERDAAIKATANQPPPAGSVYGAVQHHILAVGRYFRLDPIAETQR